MEVTGSLRGAQCDRRPDDVFRLRAARAVTGGRQLDGGWGSGLRRPGRRFTHVTCGKKSKKARKEAVSGQQFERGDVSGAAWKWRCRGGPFEVTGALLAMVGMRRTAAKRGLTVRVRGRSCFVVVAVEVAARTENIDGRIDERLLGIRASARAVC